MMRRPPTEDPCKGTVCTAEVFLTENRQKFLEATIESLLRLLIQHQDTLVAPVPPMVEGEKHAFMLLD